MGVCYLCEFIEMNFKFFYFIFYLNYIFICNDLSSFFIILYFIYYIKEVGCLLNYNYILKYYINF